MFTDDHFCQRIASWKNLTEPERMPLGNFFKYVSQGGNTQQWRSAPLALEGIWRGESEKLLYLEALLKQRIEAIDQTKMLGSGNAFATRQEAFS